MNGGGGNRTRALSGLQSGSHVRQSVPDRPVLLVCPVVCPVNASTLASSSPRSAPGIHFAYFLRNTSTECPSCAAAQAGFAPAMSSTVAYVCLVFFAGRCRICASFSTVLNISPCRCSSSHGSPRLRPLPLNGLTHT